MSKVLIIGAGPAGCVSASYLAQQGLEVKVLERSTFPRYAVGESLLPLSMEHFKEANLLEPLEQAGFETKSGALFLRDESDEIDISFSEAFTPGWTWTWQVPRDEFDDILAKQTIKNGANIKFNIEIIDLKISSTGVSVKYLEEGNNIEELYDYVIDSSGYRGVVAKSQNIPIINSQAGRNSLFTQVKDTRRHNGFDRPLRISFDVLDQDLWFWVIPFSNGNTSLGFVGDQKWFEGENNEQTFRSLMTKSKRFNPRFEGLDFLFDIKKVADYTCKADQLYGEKFVLTGNTTGFIDPVFSSGVAVATCSALQAAKLVNKELKGEKVDWSLDYQQYLKSGVEVFKGFIDAWYDGSLQDVFFANHIEFSIKKQLTSVLAGYVWDQSNPFVKKHHHLIKTLAKVIKIQTINSPSL